MTIEPLRWFAEMPKPLRVSVGGALAIVCLILLAAFLRSPEAERALVLAAKGTGATTAAPFQGASAAPVQRGALDDATNEPGLLAQIRGDDERASADARDLRQRFLREVQSRRLNAAVTTLEYLAKADP